jgi:hypothetical protein
MPVPLPSSVLTTIDGAQPAPALAPASASPSVPSSPTRLSAGLRPPLLLPPTPSLRICARTGRACGCRRHRRSRDCRAGRGDRQGQLCRQGAPRGSLHELAGVTRSRHWCRGGTRAAPEPTGGRAAAGASWRSRPGGGRGAAEAGTGAEEEEMRVHRVQGAAPVWLVGPSASPSARRSAAPRSCSPSLPTNTSTCRSSSARQLKTSLLLLPPSLVSSFPFFFARRSRSLPPRPLSSPSLGHLLRSRGAAALGVVRHPDLGVRAEGGMKSSLRTEEPAGAAAGQQRRNHRRHAAVPLRPQFRQGQILRHPPRCVACVTFPPPVRRSGDGGDCVRSFLR